MDTPTTSPDLLPGDRLVGTEPHPDFTCIRLGCGDLKAWEHIPTYFNRLGGQ